MEYAQLHCHDGSSRQRGGNIERLAALVTTSIIRSVSASKQPTATSISARKPLVHILDARDLQPGIQDRMPGFFSHAHGAAMRLSGTAHRPPRFLKPVPCRPNEPSLTVDTTARNRPGLCPEHPAKLPIRRRPDSWRCRPQRFHRRAPSGKLSRGAGSASWSHSRVRVVRSGIDSGLRALCEPGRLLRPAPPPRIRLRRQLPAPQARRA